MTAAGTVIRIISRADPLSRVREMFERELAAKGLKPLMPDDAYTNPGFKWK